MIVADCVYGPTDIQPLHFVKAGPIKFSVMLYYVILRRRGQPNLEMTGFE